MCKYKSYVNVAGRVQHVFRGVLAEWPRLSRGLVNMCRYKYIYKNLLTHKHTHIYIHIYVYTYPSMSCEAQSARAKA